MLGNDFNFKYYNPSHDTIWFETAENDLKNVVAKFF